jgi:hypothetical protein
MARSRRQRHIQLEDSLSSEETANAEALQTPVINRALRPIDNSARLTSGFECAGFQLRMANEVDKDQS